MCFTRPLAIFRKKCSPLPCVPWKPDDLVKRTIYPEIPPRVEYEITPRGKTLLPHIRGLVSWGSTKYGRN